MLLYRYTWAHSCGYMGTVTRTHTHTQTHGCWHVDTQMCSDIEIRGHTHVDTWAQTHTHVDKHALTQTCMDTLSWTQMCLGWEHTDGPHAHTCTDPQFPS